MNNKLQDILLQKALSNKLAHFYLLEPNRSISKPKDLTNWISDVLANYFKELGQNFTAKSIINHQDVLFVNKEEKGNYVLEDFDNFVSFFNYKATTNPRKFIIIENAEKIGEKLANKLLKTLEEPPIEASIFLLNTNKIKLLQTIESRSVRLRVALDQTIKEDDILAKTFDALADQDVTSFIDKFKYDAAKEDRLVKQFLDWCNGQNKIDTETTWSINDYLQVMKVDKAYNNPASQRLFKLYHILKRSL